MNGWLIAVIIGEIVILFASILVVSESGVFAGIGIFLFLSFCWLFVLGIMT